MFLEKLDLVRNYYNKKITEVKQNSQIFLIKILYPLLQIDKVPISNIIIGNITKYEIFPTIISNNKLHCIIIIVKERIQRINLIIFSLFEQLAFINFDTSINKIIILNKPNKPAIIPAGLVFTDTS